jgi:transposase
MEGLYPRCGGLDGHQAPGVAGLRLPGKGRWRTSEVQTFATTTAARLPRADGLTAPGVTPVAMESPGVYWRPVFTLLEGQFQVILGNAHHDKPVPGRQTDVTESAWVAPRLAPGRLRARVLPPRPLRARRDLTR